MNIFIHCFALPVPINDWWGLKRKKLHEIDIGEYVWEKKETKPEKKKNDGDIPI